jgi:protein-tyrosine phosphatase
MMTGTQRLLALTGTLNVRDLGGYPTPTGQTRWGAFYRADSLHALTVDGQFQLIAAGVRTVIDLRSPQEAATAPNPLRDHTAIHYHQLPLADTNPAAGTSIPENLETLYHLMLDNCQPAFHRVFTTINEAAPGAVLFHCTAGKDRTGLLAALLLGLVGVDDATIAEDYSLSAINITPMVSTMREQMRQAGMEIAAFDRLMGSDHATMLTTLAYIQTTYGGIQAYLQHLGLTPEQLTHLQARLTG